MTTEELKLEAIKLLTDLSDEKAIEEIYKLLKEAIENNN